MVLFAKSPCIKLVSNQAAQIRIHLPRNVRSGVPLRKPLTCPRGTCLWVMDLNKKESVHILDAR